MNKKDEYKTKKIRLTEIIRSKKLLNKFIDVSRRANQLTIYVYQFLRLFVLHEYFNEKFIPKIDGQFITQIFGLFKTKSAGPKSKFQNYDKVKMIYKKYFFPRNKIDGLNLSYIISYTATDILTNIENNIKLNFANYVRRFVNCMLKNSTNKYLEQFSGEIKEAKRKEVKNIQYKIKKDFLENTLKSDEPYHNFIEHYRNKIMPPNFSGSLNYELQKDPQKFLGGMIYMNLWLEECGFKQFQFFPLRKSCIIKYVPFDTITLLGLSNLQKKNDYKNDLSNHERFIWNKFFKLDHKVFKLKNHEFSFRISTDCLSTSIQFINNKYSEKVKNQKLLLKNGRQTKKLKNDKDIELLNEEKEKIEQIKHELFKKNKENFNKLSKEEKIKLTSSKRGVEFPYLDELSREELDEVRNKNKIYIDPGKKNLLYMMNNEGRFLRYSNKERLKGLKRLDYLKKINKFKKKNNELFQFEKRLTKFNSKTCKIDKFSDYIYAKNKINKRLFEIYEKEIFRKLKWYTYINTKRTESKMLNKIEEYYGKDSIILIGD